uniref:Putative TruB family pseudouridylate synthase (N terminal domain) n=1 Tax=uncultured marine microorganism HF4000_ANIW141A21 TaxID=455535 RepID=B3T578_9ZZZZ|nr:putative TruB family pseudouridylate synthase (N terminal domain) [uncultured marine microorganism HF4000_ANIW141A21]
MIEQENMIVLDEDITDPKYGSDPHSRKMKDLLDYGLICADKPSGPTSHEVVAWVRLMLNIGKAGHSGTLDPMVTGLLPIGLGHGTKALTTLLLGPKEYIAIARLHSPVDDPKLARIMKEFTGEIYQTPPQRSAVKRARRTRTIYALDLVERQGNLLIFRILCQAGTYVRKLVYDMGEILGPGATMIELRRTRVSNLNDEKGLVRLHDLFDAVARFKESGEESGLRRVVSPIEASLTNLKSMIIRDSAIEAICQGAQLAIPGILGVTGDMAPGDNLALYSQKGEVVAIGKAQMSINDIRDLEKGIAFLTDRVIMKAGTYPKMWKTKEERETPEAKKEEA